MCGIAGFVDLSRRSLPVQLEEWAGGMARAIAHRGPDNAGTWSDASFGVGFGHRRLSILDLSKEGSQPMLSASGRFCMVYNGEVYNFKQIRWELEDLGHGFRGNSDTEVILAAISQWGLSDALRRFRGIFAFALWDRQERVLHLVRDPLGVKPLYYSFLDDFILFGSELKALRAHPAFPGRIDREALALFLRLGYIESPYSIYEGVRKLPPGGVLSIPLEKDPKAAKPERYWRPAQAVAAPFPGSDEEAADELERLLKESVSMQMVADVPVGAFLSGGIDSSLVAALMQMSASRPVRTFTIGFKEAAYNEADYAESIARHLGCDHTGMTLSPGEAREAIPRISGIFDEPFADVSQIPTFLVSQLARRQVTVSLSGDGGDELFGGYTKYLWGRRIWAGARTMPFPLRNLMGRALQAVPERLIDGAFSRLRPFLPGKQRRGRMGELFGKAGRIFAGASKSLAYRNLSSVWLNPGEAALGAREPGGIMLDRECWPDSRDFAEWMMRMDIEGYLPDDILVKLDRASMAVSLEGRVPLLDQKVAEFALALPVNMKVRRGTGKWLLRQVAFRHVPERLLDRPKMGFGVPIGEWLRGPLKDWAEDSLSETRLRKEGFLDPSLVGEKWRQHKAGGRNWQHQLWAVLMFQSWLESSKMGK